jgi:hypothetical protein
MGVSIATLTLQKLDGFSATASVPSEFTHIESNELSYSHLKSIAIPHTVGIVCSECFSNCDLFSPIVFESPLELQRIKSVSEAEAERDLFDNSRNGGCAASLAHTVRSSDRYE